ncbi:hypothetical protein NW851_08225 [Synechococcus sp. H55.7]|uniref:hypothetical protein n=1 Tax=unclassified Synechococcus TaxID=2626047 RepID=UPI0039C3E1F1
MLSFWVRRNGQEEWQPVPAEGAVLEEDTYTIVARSPQPHFTITVEVRQNPGSTAATPAQIQTRSVRTNEEGIGIILPATHLTPGFWELHCRDADLIAELFGETELNNCLRFQVVPVSAQPEPAAPLAAQPTGPEPSAQTKAAAVPPELFSLMHSELEGSPDEVLVLTGRIGCSGELRVRVWQEGGENPIFQGQRLIQFPAEARTAVFSIPITLPSHAWLQPLQGELRLTPSSWGDPNRQPLTIPFSIRCRSQGGELPASSSGIPQLREASPQAASSSPAPTPTLLSPERTLQKLLRIWQHSAPEEDSTLRRERETPSPEDDPLQSAQPLSVRDPWTESPAETAELPPSPAQAEPPCLESVLPTQARAGIPEGSGRVSGTESSNSLCPTPQLVVPEQLRAGDNFDVVLRLPPMADPAGSPHQAPFWIKFWVKHGRTRSLVDGPRWLLDFSRDDQGQWQALTRLTIPPGVPELIFEAWAVSPDRQQQSDRVTERRSILP